MAAAKGNRYAEGLTTSGKPPIWSDPKKFDERVREYFEYIKGVEKERDPEPPTITGLALFMGFSTKTTLYEYAKKKEYANSIKRGLMLVEQNYEFTLFAKQSTGAIFALKNMEWRDQKQVDVTTKGDKINDTVDLSQLDDETLLRLMQAESKAKDGEESNDNKD